MIDEPSRSAAVLVSGGIDSAVLAGEMTRRFARVWPIFVRFGLRWEGPELVAIRAFLDHLASACLAPLVILNQPIAEVYGDHWSLGGPSVPDTDSPDEAVFLPGRNVLMIAPAAVWCQVRGISTLALGTLGSNPFSDGTPEFFHAMESALGAGPAGRFDLIRPFDRMTKADVMRLGSAWPIQLTFSCLAPIEGHHCGSCNKCGERRRAFGSVGRTDPTPYANDPDRTRRGMPCIE